MTVLRTSGILLHPTSLPGPHGCGDLGPEAYRFVDFLSAAKQRLWQILPLGPTGFGDSPYAALSAFAGNPLLISLTQLVEDGLLSRDGAESLSLPAGPIDFAAVRRAKLPILRRAFVNGQNKYRDEIARFVAMHPDWLPDFALFMALHERHGLVSWHDWSPELAERRPEAIAKASAALTGEIQFQIFLQFLFFRQWRALHEYARARDVRLVGDMPIYVADDSADVWAHRELFKLDSSGRPAVIAGVPPDYFSATGQRWGNPIYNWVVIAKDDYQWWIKRMRHALTLVDCLRLDHFRGFESYWEVPASEPTAINGRWVKGPGAKLFARLRQALGHLPFIAEDLGLITPAIDRLRTAFQLPGMAILQFAFDGGPTNAYLPHNLTRDCVVYTGTHDNDTTCGWYAGRSAKARRRITMYLGCDGSDIAWDVIRAASNSVADTAIFPLQDLLSLGGEARMNTPGQTGGNWRWRSLDGVLIAELAAHLAELTELSGRGARRGRPERITYTSPGDLE